MARLTRMDEDRAKTAFGLERPDKQRDNGYNVSTVSAAGERLGLYGHFVALGWARPEQVTSILARDRSGNATAWVKRFANGGSLIQLPVPRNRSGEYSRYVNAVELAAAMRPCALTQTRRQTMTGGARSAFPHEPACARPV